jgi:hypothetical protein
MEDDNKLVVLTKTILDTFQEQHLTRFESLFILEAVKSSLQEQIIKDTIEEVIKDKRESTGPGIG